VSGDGETMATGVWGFDQVTTTTGGAGDARDRQLSADGSPS